MENNNKEDDVTHFGYQKVTPREKTSKVRGVFDSVAQRYDIMNDVMSAGLHRVWKRHVVQKAGIRPGQTVLDLAGGTGDLSALVAKKLGRTGHLVLADINEKMVLQGRNRLLNEGHAQIQYVIGNAETLPFPDNYFDRIFIGFGLRNVTNKEKALESMYRTLRPGGQLLILEFSKPHAWMQPVYDAYSFKLLPKIGQWVTGDRDSYQYMVESVRMHPDQVQLAGMLGNAGFFKVDYENLFGGVIAIHSGYKT